MARPRMFGLMAALAHRGAVCMLTLFLFFALSQPAQAEPNFNLAEARKSVVFIKRVTPGLGPGVGSGFLVGKDGVIWTNRHVVQPADDSIKGTIILVGVPSAKEPDELDWFKADLVYASPAKDNLDFAILKIAGRPEYGDFKALPLSYDKVELGSDVAAIGYPHIKDNLPVLTFTKGSITAVKVPFDGRSFYQTDAAVNPGSSGGPLLNTKGEAAGIITMKKRDSKNMGYSLYLSEIKEAAAKGEDLVAKSRPEIGPLDPKNLPVSAGLAPKKENWEITKGEVREARDHLILDNDGGQYWITSKDPLPENFQLVIPCAVEFLQGKQRIQPAQRNILRMLCVRFSTEETQADIMQRKGNLIQYSHAMLLLWKEGECVKNEQKGNTEQPFTLVITRQSGTITVAVDGEMILKYEDDKPLKGGQKFSIGGYLSRLHLGEVSVLKLEEDKKPEKNP